MRYATKRTNQNPPLGTSPSWNIENLGCPLMGLASIQ